jgi:DivIVA domain-containing protein
MIDLTPLDVRNKRGDFKKLMRGYDPQEVDVFLEIVAERLEALTRENMALKERSGALQAQVNSQTDREQAVQAALVTAQELRADIRAQAQREAENVVKAAETEGRRMVAEAEAEARTTLRDAERHFDKLEDAIQIRPWRRADPMN